MSVSATARPLSSNLSTVKRIGAGERLSAAAAAEIVASLPDGFDRKVRGAVTDAVHSWACGDAERPPVKLGKVGEQRATDYGRGIDNLTKKVNALLSAADETPKPTVMRVTLSGEVSGSAVVPADSPLYAALLALIAGEESAPLTVVPAAA